MRLLVVIPTGAPATNTVANHAERPKKFNGQNFKRWQQKMFFYLTTLGLARFLKETVPQVEPPAEDPLYNVYCKTMTAKELWESLERKYKTEDAGTKNVHGSSVFGLQDVDSKTCSQVQDCRYVLIFADAQGVNPRQANMVNDDVDMIAMVSDVCAMILRAVDNGQKLYMGNSATADIKGEGDVILKMTSEKELKLTNVLYVPEIRKNLVSGWLLNKFGFRLVFESDKFVLSKNQMYVGKGYAVDAMFKLNVMVVKNDINKMNSSAYLIESSNVWHGRLGHVNFNSMRRLIKFNSIPNFHIDSKYKCETCVEAKLTRTSFKSVKRTTEPLDMIHTDICDLKSLPTKGGNKYFITFIDDCTKSDRGGEYVAPFAELCAKHRIRHEFTAPYSPQQNGIAERKNRTLKEMVTAMLISSGMSQDMWGEAILTATYLLNKIPRKEKEETPYELWMRRKPSYQYLRVWGCLAKVAVPPPKAQKIGPKSVDCIFIGYAKKSTAYRFIVHESKNPDIQKNTIMESRNASFFENIFPCLSKETGSSSRLDDKVVQDKRQRDDNDLQDDRQDQTDEEEVEPRRSKRARNEKSFGPDFVSFMVENEPTSYREAVTSSEGQQWREAIKSEIESILQNHTWELVDLPPGCKPLGYKWIFKKKMKADGTVDKYKARVVIQGFRQREGLDYFDTYSPVTRITSIRMIIAIAALRNLEIHQMDVKTAFLNGDLEEEIYMNQPEGFIAPGQEGKVCRLVKSLYGLKQAPKQWHQKFDHTMLESGFKINECDKCVYVKDTSAGYVILCLYVDDMLIVGSNDKIIRSTKDMLKSKFDMKDMGLADEVIQNGNGPVSISTDTQGQIKILPPKSAEEILARERERKARTTLLMALPEDHLARFHNIFDAKEIWDAIKTKFGGNAKNTRQAEEEEDHALMAFNSTFHNELQSYDKTDVLTYHKKLLAEAEKEKEDLKANVEKWHNSSKNLNILLNSQMSARDKAGLGYGNQLNKGVLSYENEVFQSVFVSRTSETENSPVNDRYAEGMHVQSKPSESDSRSSDFNSYEFNCSEQTHKSMPEPVVNETNAVSQPKVWSDAPIIEEYESDSEDEHVSLPNKRTRDTYEDFNTGNEDFNNGSLGVSTGSGPVSTPSVVQTINVTIPSPIKSQREGKAPMTTKEIQATKRTKAQIQQEEVGLAESMRLQALQEEEVARQVHLDDLLAKRISEDKELSEQQKKRKAEVQEAAQYYTEEDWDTIRAKLEANAKLTKSLQGESMTSEDFAKRMVEMINQKKKFYAGQKAKTRRSKPMTQAQQRDYMSTFIKNKSSWKLTQLKKLTFDELKTEFEKLMKSIENFMPIESDERVKRQGVQLEQEFSKKQKTIEEVSVLEESIIELVIAKEEEIEKSVKKRGKIRKQKARKGIHIDKTAKDESEEEREAFMKDKVTSASSESEIGIDAIPTAIKPPTILKDFSRDDLTELYRLVIKKYVVNRPKEIYDKVLWGDLKTMFDPPLSDDAIWSLPLQQKMINWRYYPSCAVHCLTLDDTTIYMLADRKYPLSKDACQVMLKMKLLDGTTDEVCYQLLKMIEKQAGLR
ncbi:retrovirus-related pol polyprotein from transposon TNT 1-94 [Tanacetum coccineum]